MKYNYCMIVCCIMFMGTVFSMKKIYVFEEDFEKVNKKIESKKEHSETKEEKVFNADKVVKELLDAELIPENSEIEKTIRTKQGTDVIFLKNNEIVIKAANSNELEALMKEFGLVRFANNLKKRYKDSALPIIIEPKTAFIQDDIVYLVSDKARGISLDAILKNLKKMNDKDITTQFFSIGEQVGNLDRIFFKEKGGILCHIDSHSENFFYDKENQQLYWIDTKGVRILPNVKSSLSELQACLRWVKEAREKWIILIEKRLLSLFNQLYEALKLKKINSNISLKPNEISLKALKFLSSLSEKENKKFLKEFKNLIREVQTYLLLVTSFGKGYVNAYPEAKKIFNDVIKSNKEWNSVVEQVKEISKILNIDEKKFLNPIQE